MNWSLSRPGRVLFGPFFMALLDLLAALEPDDAVRVLVLRSADPDFFLMHGDVEMLKDLAPA
jgi:enoyl-CoA hydratase/carnithine racemase